MPFARHVYLHCMYCVRNDTYTVCTRSFTGYGFTALDDCKFHECVDLTEFEKDRIIVIHPPHGEVKYMYLFDVVRLLRAWLTNVFCCLYVVLTVCRFACTYVCIVHTVIL